MNDDTKYRDRHIAGVGMISRLLKKTRLDTKAGGFVGAVVVTAAAVGGYYGLDIVLDDEPMPEPPPIIEPVNETSTPALIDAGASDAPGSHKPGLEGSTPSPATTPAIIEEPGQANTQIAGYTPVPAPSSNTEEPTSTPTPRPKDSTSTPSPSAIETSTPEAITPASSPVPASTSEPEPSPTVTPEPTKTPTATMTTSVVPTSTPARSDASPTGLEITWAVRFPWGVPAEAPEWVWDSMNGQIYGESTSDLLDYPRLRMAVRVGDCDAKLQVVGDLDGQTFPLGSGEVTFKLLGTGQAADIAAGPFADYYYATEGIKVSEASVSVTVYDEIAASLELPPYAATFGTNGTNPDRQRAAEKCAE